MPIILTDTQAEVPRPWIISQRIQENRLKEQRRDDELLLEIGVVGQPPPLPRLSAASVGGLWMMMRSTKDDQGDHQETEDEEDGSTAVGKLLQEVEQVATPGEKLIDVKDGRTIGQLVSTPASGTSLVLAQMRLDRVGLAESGSWSRTNRVTIGNNSKLKFSYLPFTPLWWPDVDLATGKAQEQTADERENAIEE